MMWLFWACSNGIVTTEDIMKVRVEPEEAEIRTRPSGSTSIDFTAFAELDDGSEIVLDLVSWEISNLSAGFISSEGTFTSVASNGGITEIIASHFDSKGKGTLKVIYADDIVMDDVDAGVVDAFLNATPADDDALALLYPFDNVVVPRNLQGLGFKWSDPSSSSSTVYRIRFRSTITDISVYTTLDTWISSTELWEMIAASNRDGLVEVYVEAGSWDGSSLSSVRKGVSNSLVVNRLDARGSVLYWAMNTKAIMRLPVGATEAEIFWRNPGPGQNCIGCHALSEQADRLVVTHSGANGRFSIVDIEDPESPERIIDPNDFNTITFKTVSPDGQYFFGTDGTQASLYNVSNGVRVKDWSFDHIVAHPDWSPDGSQILLVHVNGAARSDLEFNKGEIVQYDFDIESLELGNGTVLKAADDTFNYYYPAYSPDGDWIVYNRAENTPPSDQSRRMCYAAPDAELWLMSRDGSIDIRLDNANGFEPIQNSYPRWGPLPDDDVLWLAYSSRREYPLEGPTDPQIWLVGIDPALAKQGQDPSSSPFWLPGQVLQTDNHLPVWWSK